MAADWDDSCEEVWGCLAHDECDVGALGESDEVDLGGIDVVFFDGLLDEVIDHPFGFVAVGPGESAVGCWAEGVWCDEDHTEFVCCFFEGFDHVAAAHACAVEGEDEGRGICYGFWDMSFGFVLPGFFDELIESGGRVLLDFLEDPDESFVFAE